MPELNPQLSALDEILRPMVDRLVADYEKAISNHLVGQYFTLEPVERVKQDVEAAFYNARNGW